MREEQFRLFYEWKVGIGWKVSIISMKSFAYFYEKFIFISMKSFSYFYEKFLLFLWIVSFISMKNFAHFYEKFRSFQWKVWLYMNVAAYVYTIKWGYIYHALESWRSAVVLLIKDRAHLHTQRNHFEILLNQAEFRLYLPFFDWFGTANGRPFAVPNQSENGKYNLNSAWFNYISLCAGA